MDIVKNVTDAFRANTKFAAACTAVIMGIGQLYARIIPRGSATVGPVEFLYSTAPVQVDVAQQATNPAVSDPAALQFAVSKVLSVFGGGTQASIPDFIMAAAATFLAIMTSIIVWNMIGTRWLNTLFKRIFGVLLAASVIGTLLTALVVGGLSQVAAAFSIGLLVAFALTGFFTSLILSKIIEWNLFGLGIKGPALK